MKIENIKISDIIPYSNNPRINDKAVDKVAMSLKEYGWQQPIVVDKAGVIVIGHTRLLAAKKLNMDTCPVVTAEDLTDAQIKAYRIMDNKSAEFAEWDDELLNVEIQELIDMDFDIELTGFDKDFFEEMDDEPGVGDKNTEVNMDDMDEKMFIKLGYDFDEYQEIQDKIATMDILPEEFFKKAILNA